MKAGLVTKILLIAGLLFCLIQVWLPAYYLTGDGPCHVYNAQIVHDLWAGKNEAFYQPYYMLLYQPNPNWLSTVIIALLLFFVKGVIAEKIFLSLYVILYISGFYFLLKKISSGDSFWSLAVFILVFPLTLSKGFYNYSFSIAFYFWVVWSWLRFLHRRSIGNGVLFFLFTALIFFTHLLSFSFAAFTCAALLVSYTIAEAGGTPRQKFTGYFLRYAALLVLFLLPFFLLMGWFTQKEGGMQLQFGHHFYRLIELMQCKFLVNVSHQEIPVLLDTGIILISFFCFALLKFKSYRKVNKYDGVLVSLLFVAAVYLCFPESFLGTLILISMRVQLFVLLLIIGCIAYIVPLGKFRNAAGLVLFGCFLILSIIRINVQLKASAGVADYVSAAKYIKSNSVILPLDFSPQGKDEQGRVIADRNFLFSHASHYLGTEKPLIILDNYEANMGYFPIRWKDETNPYYHLSTGNGEREGIEGCPPSADIEKYRQTSGVTIDYVLTWCYDSSFMDNGQYRSLHDQIRNGYHIVYRSPSGRTSLFEKN